MIVVTVARPIDQDAIGINVLIPGIDIIQTADPESRLGLILFQIETALRDQPEFKMEAVGEQPSSKAQGTTGGADGEESAGQEPGSEPGH